jgi:hypothetical protein
VEPNYHKGEFGVLPRLAFVSAAASLRFAGE